MGEQINNLDDFDPDKYHTGSQLAAMLDIQPSRVSQIINQLNLSEYLIKKGTKKYIPKDVEDKIASYYFENAKTKSEEPKVTNDNSALIEQLTEQIKSLESDKEYLQSLLDENKKTIASLVASNYNLTNDLKGVNEGIELFRSQGVELQKEIYRLESQSLFERLFKSSRNKLTYDEFIDKKYDNEQN